ncbi:MAG TPA: sialate O-acetylesterase [Phycisphaerae bacterium]|nr:sialate O-acetylesterase [Phycisphaerae bacterium]HRY71359.1 sialate O-acetylesterase [Phycisphaerae bacterium]HSA30044.1 sialate O-acetylesterase [Phycisphaerae bacterium]
MNRARFAVAGWILFISVSLPAAAEVTLPHVISNGMVLQRGMPLPIWGWASPGESVTVTLGDQKMAAIADEDGRWQLRLAPLSAPGPHEMVVTGRNRIVLKDILVGEVWIASGQSNMQMTVNASNKAAEETAAAGYPRIRLFSVPRKLAGLPAADLEAKWEVCSPKTIGAFSAVAYFFGRELHRQLDVPVGLINTSWGGTRIEPWTPPFGFAAVPSLQDVTVEIDKANQAYDQGLDPYVARTKDWVSSVRKAMKSGRTVATAPAPPEHPLLAKGRQGVTTMYNAMVVPLAPYAIRGALWYQGEANTGSGDGMLYHEKMKALIGGWRKAWGQGDFPFLYVQLAPYQYNARRVSDTPDRLPRIWEAQLATLSVPNTGMAVITDIGNTKDIHPKNKQEVGRRLSLWALARTYGRQDLVYSGPLYKSMAVEGNRIRLSFEHIGGGLASRDGKPLTHFQVAGADRKFVEAQATIDGSSIVVSGGTVTEPVAVRFGWDELAEPNLMNKEGLPASPFRTDSW